jgi:hypothetical protein
MCVDPITTAVALWNLLIVSEMGQTGSYTSKIEVATPLTIFTKWNTQRVKELMKICHHTLSDTFALRIQEVSIHSL